MPKQVKAVVMTGPGKIETQMLPYPKLERGALILKVGMSGICGTDKHAFKGEKVLYGGTEAEQEIVYPGVRGHENVGEIVDIDPADQNLIEYEGKELKVGDRVTMCPNVICGLCWYCRNIFAYPFCAKNTTIGLSYRSDMAPWVGGGWAEYMFVPPKAWVYKVPEDMPDELAALTELFVVAATLDRAKEFSRIEARGFGFADTVTIQGAGAIGCMHVAKAKMLGAGQIIILDESDTKLRLAKEFGADVTINVKNVTQAERIKIIKDLTSGRGSDVTVETAGTAKAFTEGLEYTRRGGTYVETGSFVDTGDVPLNVHRHIAAKNVLIIGNSNHPHNGYAKAIHMMMKFRKEYPFEKLITHVFSLDDGKIAMDKSFELDCLKVMFKPSMR